MNVLTSLDLGALHSSLLSGLPYSAGFLKMFTGLNARSMMPPILQ